MSNAATSGDQMPLDSEQTRRVLHAVEALSVEQLNWVSAYVAGLAAGRQAPPPANDSAAAKATLTVLYGSQTGNGRDIAERLAASAGQRGFAVRLANLADYKPSALRRESLLALVISTHGDGEPPDDAELFHEYLLAGRAPQLAQLRYSVLALGDSSYADFCETGREIDARLEALGARRFADIRECDLDYETPAAQWSAGVLDKLPELLPAARAARPLHAVPAAPDFDRQRPFAAEVLVQQKITGAGSSKDVYHLELSLEGSGLRYEPGDALAVVTDNPPQLVAELIDLLGIAAGDEVDFAGDKLDVATALRERVEITALNRGFIEAWAALSGAGALRELLETGQREALASLFRSHQVVDVVRAWPAAASGQDFLACLRPLSPRSYSIASGPTANPDEVHLTVAAVRYRAFGLDHRGAASTLLADRVRAGDTVPVYVERNPRFRLPADEVPIIMIGPGTGVAPFRAFVEERIERGASGANWLFFGDRNFQSDFLYQLEWQRHLRNGHLQRLDLAFSRDQQHKLYVQQRIVENGAEIYRWLQDGAVVYVCGDAQRMAGDVDAALASVLAEHGRLEAPQAQRQLKELRRSGRYQRDVY